MQPTFITLPEIKAAGVGTRFFSIMSPKADPKVIPALWHEYMQQFDKIPHKVEGMSLGLVEMLPASDKSDPMEMYYVAATPVSSFEGLPGHLVSRTLPAGRYAQFTHKGSLSRLGATMQAIYKEWMPRSGVRLRPVAHVERYDKRFDIGSEKSEFDILIPVE